jgi:hypothetical protein
MDTHISSNDKEGRETRRFWKKKQLLEQYAARSKKITPASSNSNLSNPTSTSQSVYSYKPYEEPTGYGPNNMSHPGLIRSMRPPLSPSGSFAHHNPYPFMKPQPLHDTTEYEDLVDSTGSRILSDMQNRAFSEVKALRRQMKEAEREVNVLRVRVEEKGRQIEEQDSELVVVKYELESTKQDVLRLRLANMNLMEEWN